jgi:hypothetical protein
VILIVILIAIVIVVLVLGLIIELRLRLCLRSTKIIMNPIGVELVKKAAERSNPGGCCSLLLGGTCSGRTGRTGCTVGAELAKELVERGSSWRGVVVKDIPRRNRTSASNSFGFELVKELVEHGNPGISPASPIVAIFAAEFRLILVITFVRLWF